MKSGMRHKIKIIPLLMVLVITFNMIGSSVMAAPQENHIQNGEEYEYKYKTETDEALEDLKLSDGNIEENIENNEENNGNNETEASDLENNKEDVSDDSNLSGNEDVSGENWENGENGEDGEVDLPEGETDDEQLPPQEDEKENIKCDEGETSNPDYALQDSEETEDVISSGNSNSISWKIYADGKLTIDGSGDYELDEEEHTPWWEYRDKIISAEVSVTEMTSARNMFSGCSKLERVDLSKLYADSIINMEGIFDGATALIYIAAPLNCTLDVSLPVNDASDKWYDGLDSECTTLPQNLSVSVKLYKNGYPGDGNIKIEVSISGLNIGDKIYDGNPYTFDQSNVIVETGDGEALSDIPNMSYLYSGTLKDGSEYEETSQAPNHAGNYSLLVTVDDTIYEGQASYNFTITPKDITITALTVSIKVGENLPDLAELEYNTEGLVNADELYSLPRFKYGEENIDTFKEGSYDIIPYDAYAGDDYSIIYVNGKLEITPNDDTPDIPVESGILKLNIDSDSIYPEGYVTIHSNERLTMYADSSVQVSAKVEKQDGSEDEDIPIYKISWESSNENTVIAEYGIIEARAAGMAQITAEYGGLTAVIRVEVLESVNDRSDRNNYMHIEGFKRESEDFVYNGNAITQDLKVYHNNKLLKEKTDYTLTYKNNVNAAAYNSAKAPCVTVKLKGQYTGSTTLYYTISPMDINDISESDSLGYEQAVNYGKNIKIPMPTLMFGKKKLAASKDFVCDYTTLPADYKKGDSYTAGEVYNYTVNGIGNYTGSFQMQLVVVGDKNYNFSSASVVFAQKQYEYHGTALSKSEVEIKQVKLKTVLDSKFYDYEVCTNGIDGSYVMVSPTEAGREAGYRGSKKVALKLVGDRDIKNAVLTDVWKESIIFSQKAVDEEGGVFQAKAGILAYGSGTDSEILIEDKDYSIKYGKAVKAGNVTVTFTGKGRYKGTLKKKYVIKPDIEGLQLSFGNVKEENDTFSIAYQKGGAVPDVILKDRNNNVLKNKTDYTVKLKDNKTPGTVMSCEVNGKGNYSGYQETVQIMVTKGDISKAVISVPDMAYSEKQDAWKAKVTLTDVNGKKLTAGKDYVGTPEYSIDGGLTTPQIGSTVSVTVQGMGDYEGSVNQSGSYRIYDKSKSINKLKITIEPQEYTGEEITLRSGRDIHVYANSADAKKKQNELYNVIEIVGYKNNTKSGTAKVTLRGIGDYGGTKTFSFKIQKKKFLIIHVKGISLNKTNMAVSLQSKEAELIAELKPEKANETVGNTTVIWTSSNSDIATVDRGVVNGNFVTAIITPQKEGSVTITATAQDGNKKASCKVKIVNVPILKEAGSTIEGVPGDTYQLEFEQTQGLETNTNGIEWESSNAEVVSVSDKGLLTMNKAGTAVIKVYAAKRSFSQQCYVIVKGDENITEGNDGSYSTITTPDGKKYLKYEKAYDYVNDGSVNDAVYINNLIDRYHWNSYLNENYAGVYLPAGVYWVDAETKPIVMVDNLELLMSPGTLIMTIPNGNTNYNVIWAYQISNISISGGTIIGERNEHTSNKGQWGFGIGVYDCTNVTISDMDISQCWGDGIELAASEDSDVNATCTNVTIINCNVHDNRRNNLGITAADYVTVENCKFNYAKGTDPQFGIDIETNNSKNPCEHIIIRNTEMKGNKKASMGIMTVANDIRLENCTLDGHFYNWAGKNVVLKGTTIKGEIVDKTGGIRRE